MRTVIAVVASATAAVVTVGLLGTYGGGLGVAAQLVGVAVVVPATTIPLARWAREGRRADPDRTPGQPRG